MWLSSSWLDSARHFSGFTKFDTSFVVRGSLISTFASAPTSTSAATSVTGRTVLLFLCAAGTTTLGRSTGSVVGGLFVRRSVSRWRCISSSFQGRSFGLQSTHGF